MTSTSPDPTDPVSDPPDTPQGPRAKPLADLGSQQLSGFRIAVTSDRRSGDLIAALERRGAQVLHAPALRIAPIAEDGDPHRGHAHPQRRAPDTTVVTTAWGMRRWSEAADAAGIGEETATLAASRILVRVPEAGGAVCAASLNDDGIAADEPTSTLVDTLLVSGVEGQTIAVQLHGYADVEQLRRLEAVCSRSVDLVTFTSAPAVDALFSTAGEMGCADELVAALRSRCRRGRAGHGAAAHRGRRHTHRPRALPAGRTDPHLLRAPRQPSGLARRQRARHGRGPGPVGRARGPRSPTRRSRSTPAAGARCRCCSGCRPASAPDGSIPAKTLFHSALEHQIAVDETDQHRRRRRPRRAAGHAWGSDHRCLRRRGSTRAWSR